MAGNRGAAVLDAAGLHRAFLAYADVLAAHAPRLNALNAFPVPDADTGTNMAATATAAVVAIAEPPSGEGLAGVCDALADGAFLGARGNSGTILAQLLGGFCEVARAAPALDGAVLADALARAAAVGPLAVREPVPGTILTVAADLAFAAVAACSAGADLARVLHAAQRAAVASVERTTALNPVLAAAGVVDAGGVGFALLLDALWHATDGRDLPVPPVSVERPLAAPGGHVAAEAAPGGHRAAEAAPGQDHGVASPAFEVMFLLEGGVAAAAASEGLARLGESVVVAGRPGRLMCHVHTDDVDAVAQLAAGLGSYSGWRVERL